MKKAIHTLFRPQSWKLTLMLVFAWCCFSLQNVNAQDIVMEYSADDTTQVSITLDSCGTEIASDDIRFTDDGSNDGNYSDSHARIDTVEICPIDQWHRVKVVFTDFDLEEGDTLFAKDGNIAAVQAGTAPAIGSGTGVGVAKAFGGWAQAACSATDNPSGCITFLFKTDGDNKKGSGWDAWVDCEEKEVTISDPVVADVRLKCDEYQTTVTINAPTVKACGDELPGSQDSVRMLIKNQHGNICVDTCLTKNSSPVNYTGDFTIGQYSVEFILKTDTEKTSKSYFAVQAPSLVCNDEVNIPFGASCTAVLAPDDVLEQTCDTIAGIMYYNITITIGSGKTEVVKKTTGHDNLGAVEYPIITKDDIADAGLSVCGGTATVKIERIYYGDRDGDGNADIPTGIDCNNGTQSLFCETTLKFSDVVQPWVDITSAPDTLIACDTTGLYSLLSADGIDNCDDDADVSFTVTFDEAGPCFDANGSPDTTTATVTFSAVDDCGNVGTATHTVTFIRPDIHDTRFVAKTETEQVECTEEASIPRPGVKIGIWKNNAFEATDTIELNTTDYICGYILTKSEENIPSTDCGKKKYIYWDATDWCDSAEGPRRIDTTFIEYTDETAPEFDEGEGENTDIELDPFSCTYDITKIAIPEASDNCDDNPTVWLDMVSRIEDGGLWTIPTNDWDELDCDSFQLKWIAQDDCHEQLVNDTLYQIVVIKDVTAPSAICTDELIVSVPTDEGAKVFVNEIDGGSSDFCGIASREVRRDDSDVWGDHVIITCEDVHEEVKVLLRITDNKGNINTCWMTITAEDKIPPICIDLEDESLTCKEIHTGELGASTDADEDGEFDTDEWQPLTGDLMGVYNTRFGTPDCEDNLTCGILTYEQEYQLIELDCGALKAKRRYRANDWKPNSSAWAEQNITVTYVPEWTLNFPADIDLTCTDQTVPAASTAAQVIDNGSCDLWALEVTADTFEVGDGVCLKIERHYEVINWCVYEAGSPSTLIAHDSEGETVSVEGNEDKGRFTYTQVIKLYITDPPTVSINDVNTCIVGVGDAIPYGEEDDSPGAPIYECDTIRTFSAVATNCVGTSLSDFEWKFYIDDVLVDEGDGGSFDQVVQPKLNYTVEFWAFDGCGNSKGTTRDFQFWDCKKPTPYVLNGLAIELGQTRTVDVWAVDLDQGSYDNCTDQDDLELYIAIGEPNAGPTDIDGVRALGKKVTLGCDNVGTQSVSIYVVDEEGNWDVVGTYVLVQNNQVNCTNIGEGMVAGSIVNPNGENVEQVSVSVSGAMQESMTTGADGNFQFDLLAGGNYTVTPVKDMNPLNGVSTFDLVLISKHILGITSFDSPYKYIAADVNKSGTITAFDMVQLRQLILNIHTEFANNDSWRFVDAKHEFTNADPLTEEFAEFMNIDQLTANRMDVDFVGVKIGDVNINAAANSLLGAESRTTNGTLNFNVTDRFVEVGETVTVDFKSTDIPSAQGFQFTMNFSGLKLNKLDEGVAKAANFNTNLAQRGLITSSWNGEATADDILFSLTFNATASGLLSELITLSSDVTTAEAYNTNGELLDVKIEFSSNVVATGFELGQNSPNPFNGETLIGFNLPEAGTAKLTVMNVQGKVLKEIKGDYAKGYNTIVLKARELGATGVLHYQLESANQVATKKMVIIE